MYGKYNSLYFTSRSELITKEEVQTGSVSLGVYYNYTKTVGLPAFFFLTIAWGLAESSFTGSRIWLKEWSDGLPTTNSSKINEFQQHKIVIYALFGLMEGLFYSFLLSVQKNKKTSI